MTEAATNRSNGLDLVIVMPALNEEATVGETVRRIPASLPGVGSIRVLVVDDGSTDRTRAEAEAAGAVVISHHRCLGVGAAFQTGLSRAMEVGADLVVNMDSDGQFDPATLPALIEPVVSGRADFSTASRFADSRLAPKMPWIKRWGNRAMSRLISRLIGQEFHDVSCGMRCYNRRAALNLNLMGAFTYTQEVFLNLAYKRLRLVEVPLRVEGERKHGKSRVARSVFRYGCRALAIIFRCYRDYRPMRFFGRTAAVLIAMAVLLEGFFFGHYLVRHSFHPHLWAGFTGAAMLFLGLLSLHMGLIGDMLARHRIYLEELLYSSRLQASDNGRANGGKPEKGNP